MIFLSENEQFLHPSPALQCTMAHSVCGSHAQFLWRPLFDQRRKTLAEAELHALHMHALSISADVFEFLQSLLEVIVIN